MDSEPVSTPHGGDDMPLDNFTIRPSVSGGPFAGAHSLAALLVSMNSSPGPHALIRCAPSILHRFSDADSDAPKPSAGRRPYRPRVDAALRLSLVLKAVPIATSSDGGARAGEILRVFEQCALDACNTKTFRRTLKSLVTSGAISAVGSPPLRRYWRRA